MAIAKDFLKDLENEEFFAKNFRVRPVSGAPGVGGGGAGGDDRQSEYQSRNNLGESTTGVGAGENEEDKVNKMMYMEMEEQRKRIKTMR
jgi:hypothetical protein